MAIKEPIFRYRKYRVTPTVEYIPCLPCTRPTLNNPFQLTQLTATRIPKGAEVTFLEKYDNELVEVVFRIDSSKDEYHVLVMNDFICENLLPIYKR